MFSLLPLCPPACGPQRRRVRQLLLLLRLAALFIITAPAWAQGPPEPAAHDTNLRVVRSSCKWAELSWTSGGSNDRAVILTDLTANAARRPPRPNPNMAPRQGAFLVGNGFFGIGSYTQDSAYVVYSGRPVTSIYVTGLIKGHRYQMLTYPYNRNAQFQTTYLLSRPNPDTLRFTTPSCPDVTPTQPATQPVSQVIDCSTARLTCRPGNGQKRLFVLRVFKSSGGGLSVENERTMLASNLFSRGFETTFNSLTYAVYAGTDTSVTVYGLPPGQQFRWSVFEYNTVPGPNFLPDEVTPFYRYGTNSDYFSTPSCTGEEPASGRQTRNVRVVPGSLTPTSVQLQWHPSMGPGTQQANPIVGQPPVWVPGIRSSDDGEGSYVVIHNALSGSSNPFLPPGSPQPQPVLPLPVQNTVPLVTSSRYGQGSPVRPGQDSVYSLKLTRNPYDTTITVTGLRPGTVYEVNVFTFRYPRDPALWPVVYTYFLSRAQATVVFGTPQPSPLPVTLTRFTATHVRGTQHVATSWATASELRNAGFEVQRSLDGLQWAKVGFEPGHGTSATPHTYTLSTPYVGAAYYRLAQLDDDGRVSYSPVVHVGGEGAGLALRVHPNPTNGDFTVQGGLPTEPIEVLDLLGKQVKHLPAGQRTGRLDGMPAGVYLLRQGQLHTRLVRE